MKEKQRNKTQTSKQTETKNGLTAEDIALLSKPGVIFAVVILCVQVFVPPGLWKVAKQYDSPRNLEIKIVRSISDLFVKILVINSSISFC